MLKGTIGSRRILTLFMCAALVVSLWVYPGSAFAAADDDIPGVTLPPNPVKGSLGGSDRYDVYRFYATAGTYYTFQLYQPENRLGMALYGPSAKGVEASEPINRPTEHLFAAPYIFTHRAGKTGYYYIAVVGEAEGSYSLYMNKGKAQRLDRMGYSPAIRAGSSAEIFTTLRRWSTTTGGFPTLVSDKRVYLDRYLDAAWRNVSYKATNSTGDVTFKVSPTVNAKYRFRVPSSSPWVFTRTQTIPVTVKAYLSTPTLSATSVSLGTSITARGYLKPRHTAGTSPVRIYRYLYEGGSWKYKGYSLAKVSDYSSYSKYSGSVKLPTAGRWKLRAVHPQDSRNSLGASGLSAEVTVK